MKKAELEAKGVNFDNLKEPFGNANIITQFWAAKQKETEDYGTQIRMDVYMPRKNRIWECEDFDMANAEDRERIVTWLRDSVERHKIFAILLNQIADEIEQTGECSTSCYYPCEDYER